MPPARPKPTPRARTERARKGLRSRGQAIGDPPPRPGHGPERRRPVHRGDALDRPRTGGHGGRDWGAPAREPGDLRLPWRDSVPGTRLHDRRERRAPPRGPGVHRARDRGGGAHRRPCSRIRHHAPSRRSIRPWFEGDPFNCAFASDLDRVIERFQPELWVHGHMHDPVDERLGRTRLVANPAGYRYEAKEGFDPALVLDLEKATA